MKINLHKATKGSLAVDIIGRDDKDELRIVPYNVDGKQLQNKKEGIQNN